MSAHTDAVHRTSHRPHGGYLDATVRSPYCDALLRRGMVTLVRSSEGTLLGDSLAPDGVRPSAPLSRARCTPGTSTGRVSLDAIPAGADDTCTKIYPYGDVAEPPAPTSSSPTAPIN